MFFTKENDIFTPQKVIKNNQINNLMRTISEIKALVGDNRVEEAITALIACLGEKDDTLTNQLILTKGRFKQYVTSINLGLEERNEVREQIVNSVLMLADDAERYIQIIEIKPITTVSIETEVSIKGNDEIIAIIYMYLYAYNVNDFDFMKKTLNLEQVDLPYWKSLLKSYTDVGMGFTITKIEPITEDLTEAIYKAEYFSKPLRGAQAFDRQLFSDVFTLQLDAKRRWKIVFEETVLLESVS